jgi:hypothetical protein
MYKGLEEDFATDPDLLSHLATSKERLQVFLNTNYAPRSRQSVSHQGSSTSVASLGYPQKVNFTSRYQMKEHIVVNELDDYFKLPQEDFDTYKPLNWCRCSQFPRLYRLVIDIFSIPGKLCMIILHYNFSNMVQALQLLLRGFSLEDVTQFLFASLIPVTIQILMLVKRLKLARVTFGRLTSRNILLYCLQGLLIHNKIFYR